MIGQIRHAVKQGQGEAVLYAGLIGLLVSDIVPTPADAVYFRLMEKNKLNLGQGKITPKQYWIRDAVLYYGLNPLWWAMVMGVVVLTKGTLSTKVKLSLGLIGGGAVFGVLAKNIKEDEKLMPNFQKNT